MQIIVPDPEWTALEAGIKPAVRIALRASDAHRLADGLRSRGASVVTSEHRVRFGLREPETILYVAKNAARAEALRDAEARTLDTATSGDRREAHREVGRLLGYPSCCVDQYIDVITAFDALPETLRTSSEDYLHARAALPATRTFPHSRVNPLLLTSRIRLVTFYPCRYDCPDALEYANALHAAMMRKDRKAAEALDEALACTVALSPMGARALIENGHAKAPPRPLGMTDERGDQAFAVALDRAMGLGESLEGMLTVSFRRAE